MGLLCTRLIGALSSLSSNQGLMALEPVNQILWHLQNTLFVHSQKFTYLPKLMEGKEGHDKVVIYRANKMHKDSYLFSQALRENYSPRTSSSCW
jgi:hypothetical protein